MPAVSAHLGAYRSCEVCHGGNASWLYYIQRRAIGICWSYNCVLTARLQSHAAYAANPVPCIACHSLYADDVMLFIACCSCNDAHYVSMPCHPCSMPSIACRSLTCWRSMPVIPGHPMPAISCNFSCRGFHDTHLMPAIPCHSHMP